MNWDDDDLQLSIQTTWVESNGSGYDRVVVMDFFCTDCIMSGSEIFRTVGQLLRERVAAKLKRDLGLIHPTDYIFGIYDNPEMRDGKWIVQPIPGDMRTIVRLRDEEHFVMLKMHYSDN